jgi:hypothetical protein
MRPDANTTLVHHKKFAKPKIFFCLIRLHRQRDAIGAQIDFKSQNRQEICMHRHHRKIIALILLCIPVLALAVMLLWNTALAGALGVPAISFWQALGILLLARILFGGFKGLLALGLHGSEKHFALRNRWHSMMNPEEKENFLQRGFSFHHHRHHADTHGQGGDKSGPCEKCACPRHYCERIH